MTLLLWWESPPKEQKGELGVSQHCWPSFCLSGQILKWLVHSWALVLKLGAALAHREPPHTSTSSERSPTHSLSGQRKRAWQGLRQVSDDVIISLSHHLLIIQNTVSHLHLSQPGVCRRKFTLTTCFHSRVSQNWVAHSAFCSERAHVTKELSATTQRRILLIWI